jgi:hypothetical protein
MAGGQKRTKTTGEAAPLIEVAASPGRRWFALGCLYGLGLIMAALVIVQPPPPAALIFMLAAGGLFIAAAEALRRATEVTLRLTEVGLADSRGRILARWDEIERIDRGLMAMKPTGGFLLVLAGRAPRAWVPGMWWRSGRRIGVGGVLPQRPTRAMAEMIALRIASGEQG